MLGELSLFLVVHLRHLWWASGNKPLSQQHTGDWELRKNCYKLWDGQMRGCWLFAFSMGSSILPGTRES